jgi:hypothetical protein
VTPWNKNGYEYAIKYGAKIDVVSPVWYEMGHKIDGDIWVEGTMNTTWLRIMKEKNPRTKIYPRLVFKLDTFTQQDLVTFLTSEQY